MILIKPTASPWAFSLLIYHLFCLLDMSTSTDDNPVIKVLGHRIYQGIHPVENEGWQIAFEFGEVKASVACTPTTDGIEVYAWKGGEGLWAKARTSLTGPEVLELLIELMNIYSKGEPMLNTPTQTATKYQIIVDQYASGSLAFVNKLTQVATVAHLGDGVYEVTGVSGQIDAVIGEHEGAVLKVEAM